MSRVHFLAAGRWAEHRVRTAIVPSTMRIDTALNQRIELAWSQAMRAPGVRLFDGPICRLERISASTDELTLELSETSYRIFVGTNMSGRVSEIPPESRANPVGVSAGIVSADGFLMLGLRNSAVAFYPDKVHPFAGTINRDDRGNVFEGVRRELREELQLGDGAFDSILCLGLVEDPLLMQPELIFIARTSLPVARIARQVDPAEHRRAWSIPADVANLNRAMSDFAGQLTPVALATLLLVGRELAGEEWFTSRRTQFTSSPRSA